MFAICILTHTVFSTILLLITFKGDAEAQFKLGCLYAKDLFEDNEVRASLKLFCVRSQR